MASFIECVVFVFDLRNHIVFKFVGACHMMQVIFKTMLAGVWWSLLVLLALPQTVWQGEPASCCKSGERIAAGLRRLLWHRRGQRCRRGISGHKMRLCGRWCGANLPVLRQVQMHFAVQPAESAEASRWSFPSWCRWQQQLVR